MGCETAVFATTVILLFVGSLLMVLFGTVGLAAGCNYKTVATIVSITPSTPVECVYDLSYIAGGVQRKATTNGVCPSQQFNGTSIDACYGKFDLGKIKIYDTHYMPFPLSIGLLASGMFILSLFVILWIEAGMYTSNSLLV